MPFSSSMGLGLELFGGSVVAELRNPASIVAQAELHNPGSCAIC